MLSMSLGCCSCETLVFGNLGVSSFLFCFLFLLVIVLGGLAAQSEWGVLWVIPSHSVLCTQCLILGQEGFAGTDP